jgi:hypothetical protein
VNPDGPTGRTHPHPRYYGTFPRVLGRYVRELKVIALPAVKKMTSMNADKLGITDRGRLKEGLAPDVTSDTSSSTASSRSRTSSIQAHWQGGFSIGQASAALREVLNDRR